MRNTIRNLQVLGATALAALAVGVTGCHGPGRTTGQAVNDKMTEYHVDHALNGDAVLKFPNVHANVFNGAVQLTGFVSTQEQRAKAAEIAANVPGVAQVVNEIEIRPTPTGRAPIRDPLKGQEQQLAPSAPNQGDQPQK